MEIEKPKRQKRTHTEEFRRELVRACMEPGTSISGIALANGVNANLLRKWIQAREGSLPKPPMVKEAAEFVPVTITPMAPPIPEIHIEARRGSSVVKIDWPVSAAEECGAWLRDWLK